MTVAKPRKPQLVGRDDVLAALAEERDSSTIAGRTVIVAGEAGIGKTMLIRVFGEESRRCGFAVVEGACVEIERRRPFGAFVEVLASCIRGFGMQRIRGLITEHALYLKPLLGETMGDAPAGSQTPEDRYRIHGSMLALVESLARSRPMIMIVEDLHWADDASLELFAYLARRIRHKPVLLIGTYRSDEVDRRHPLRPTLGELANARVTRELTLPRLGAAATLEILRATTEAGRMPVRLLHEVAGLIHRKCDGNPLFVDETIRLLTDAETLTFGEEDWTAVRARVEKAVPRSISDVTLARVAGLSSDAQRLLATAAVVGEAVDLALTAAVMELPEAQLLDLLHEAITAGILIETDDGIRFRHALTREAIRLSLLTWDRRRLHRGVAEEMERRAAGPDELAYHFDEAGLAERAVDYYEQAAQAAAALTPAGAARALERAIDLTEEGDVRRPRLYTRLSDFLLYDGRTGQAERTAIAAMKLTERSGDLVAKSEAMVALASVYREGEDWEKNRAVLTSLRELVEPQGDSATLARVYTELGLCVLPIDGAEALRLIERAIDVAEAIDARNELVFALQMRGVALFMQDRSGESLPVLERALQLARSVAVPRQMRSVMENLKDAHSEFGDEAPEMERQRREEVRSFDRLHGVRAPRVLGQELEWLFADGDWDGLLRRSVEVDERAPSLMAQTQLYVAVISVAREGLHTADRLRSAYSDLVAVGRPDKAALAFELALLLAEQPGDVVELAVRMGAPLPTRWADPDERGLAALVGGIAARVTGDHEAARQLSAVALEPRLYLKRRRYDACVAFVRAEIAREHGDLVDAVRGYAEAAALSRGRIEWSSSWFESLAHLCRAEVQLQRGGDAAKGAAQHDFDAGLGYWRDAKATYYLQLLCDRAHRLGLDFPTDGLPRQRAPTESDPLTKRQREIALLVAEGLTNREIGERMTLSVRTVESHVEQIRAKLGFHTRAQIAAWVTERYGGVRVS